MKALKDIKILSLVLIVCLGLGFEALKNIEIITPHQESFGRAGELFAIHRESVQPLEKKTLRQPKAALPKIDTKNAVKFDLKAAISSYQKEHGLEETEAGAKQKPDLLKEDPKKSKKKKVAYEYVFDAKSGKWVKRKKLNQEQREYLLARKLHAEYLKKLTERKTSGNPSPVATADSSQSVYGSNFQNSQNQNQGPQGQSSGGNDETPQKSYEEWAQLLLDRPNPAGVQEIIAALKSSAVSTDIYYRIAKELVDNPRPEMKEQALQLISVVPSVQAFRLASELLANPGTPDLATKISAMISKNYTTQNGLNVLSKVLAVKDNPSMTLIALQTLDEAIVNLLNQGTQGGTYVSSFTPFRSVLTDLSQSPEAEVASRASVTLAQLQSSLSNLNNVAANTESRTF